jgi:L-threonylcarbamoyladenylate synthase
VKSAKKEPAERRTLHLQADSPEDLRAAAAILIDGGLVAIPTETVYGLAANALDAVAVEKIFVAKQRPHWDPLIVHVSDRTMLERVVRQVPPPALPLIAAFWPGALTLLLPRHPDLPDAVTAGRDLVGVRMPSHPAALALIREAKLPLAAPSANRFGHISPTTVAHVLGDLDGRIDAVLDAGPCAIGVESTVLDPTASPMVLYRQGGVSCAQIEAVVKQRITVYRRSDDVTKPAARPESLPSPGVGIRHYAPHAKLMLVHTQADLDDLLHHVTPEQTGVMLPLGWAVPGWTGKVFSWECWSEPAALARTLYTGLRALDAMRVRTIVCPLPPAGEEPMVEAIRDRLLKAARES